MENQNESPLQSELLKILIGGIIGIVVIILPIVLLAPLPFIRPMWEANILRWRMYEAVSNQIIGMSQDEVHEMLGVPQIIGRDSGGRDIAYSLNSPGQRWRHMLIFINEDGMVERVRTGNPIHSGFFG